MRPVPQPGQVTPKSAFVGHEGVTPPGVVGSARAMKAHSPAPPTATTTGAARDVERVRRKGKRFHKTLAPEGVVAAREGLAGGVPRLHAAFEVRNVKTLLGQPGDGLA